MLVTAPISSVKLTGKSNLNLRRNIMTNSKLLKLAATSLISALALTSQLASAEGAFCNDWNFNDPSCSSYIKPSGKQAESNVKPIAVGVFCEDWSFNDPSCPAFHTATAAGGMQPVSMKGGTEGPLCSDWSFNDSSCSAYITH